MKKHLFFILLAAICVNIPAFADNPTDADVYWIKEDFSQFEALTYWIVEETSYPTYPNNVDITTIHANVETAGNCAVSTFGNSKAMRVRGLRELGSLQFTVPGASKVIIKVTGKSGNLDRTVLIYRNNELVKTFENLDNSVCEVFEEDINSDSELTYKITAGNIDSTDPIVVASVTVVKYGAVEPKEPEEPKLDYSKYWIYEDFSQFEAINNWIIEEESYPSNPNNIDITTTYANVEAAGNCAVSTFGNTKVMRVRGLQQNGSLQFTVPDANKVTIKVTGKSNSADRTVLIYRNNELIKTFENLDNSVCVVFEEDIDSNTELTYKVTAGNIESTDPIVVTAIIVEKYDFESSVNTVNNSSLSFYPNPIKNVIYFSQHVDLANLYDINGRLVSLVKNANQMNIQDLNKGIYVIKISTSGGTITGKLIKE